MDGQTKVRVTIWAPYFAGCMLAFGRDDVDGLGVLDVDAELQREVFTWPVEEDVWAGITNDAKRAELEERFTTEFQPTRLPAERDMVRFAAFVEALEGVIASADSEWSVGSSGAAEKSAAGFMFNGLLALHTQLRWMLDIYRDLPGASVSVR